MDQRNDDTDRVRRNCLPSSDPAIPQGLQEWRRRTLITNQNAYNFQPVSARLCVIEDALDWLWF
jgi:hypothetical protein